MEDPRFRENTGAEIDRARARARGVRVAVFSVLGLLASFAVRGGALQAVWDALTGHRIEVSGSAIAASHAKLSEHNVEWVNEQVPQVQAEFLMSAAINHERGATELIEKYLDRWRDRLERTPEWERLARTALYSSDLRVRAAALEIDLTVNRVRRTEDAARELMDAAESDESRLPWTVWTLGMLANRGVQERTIRRFLVEYTYDPAEETRFWAVEGLAHIGTDETIPEFLRILGTDPSMKVRERAGCSLAKSGMLTRGQRMKAVPGLIELAEDPNLEPRPRKWVYQALREITDVSLTDDPGEWRYWYSSEGAELARSFDSEPWHVLGNS